MSYPQNFGYANPYYGMNPNQGFTNMPRVDNQYPQYAQPQPNFIKQTISTLQGKSVDSIEVVKATEIPLDGSVSYFPLTDGSAIITKQLQMDGTSKTVIYKPVDSDEPIKSIKYITQDELDETLKNFDTTGLKDEIKSIKKQIKDMNKSLRNKDYEEED